MTQRWTSPALDYPTSTERGSRAEPRSRISASPGQPEKQGKDAAAEFQKIIDHPGICQAYAACALAHLQLGRAKAMAGDNAGARAAYQDFLALWKDADPDVPVLKEAKTEYAKLQ